MLNCKIRRNVCFILIFVEVAVSKHVMKIHKSKGSDYNKNIIKEQHILRESSNSTDGSEPSDNEATDLDQSDDSDAPSRLFNALNDDTDKTDDGKCWMQNNVESIVKDINDIEVKHAEAKTRYIDSINIKEFDQRMFDTMMEAGGAALRNIQRANGDRNVIPKGINLGGPSIIRLSDNIMMFFHRMKLRNNTHFTLNYLHNDLASMALVARLDLHDLHLTGSFERDYVDNIGNLYYRPNYGEINILLKDVKYKMQGRYRLVEGHLFIEMIVSELLLEPNNILITYTYENGSCHPEKLPVDKIDYFRSRLQTDLDIWLKDYFNDYLLHEDQIDANSQIKYQAYDKAKTKNLNRIVDETINQLKKRLVRLKAVVVAAPTDIRIFAVNGMELSFKKGVLRGLNSMYRKSAATVNKQGQLYDLNAIVAFSKLKLEYEYVIKTTTETSVMNGRLILSADELTAHMGLTLTKDTKDQDFTFRVMKTIRPESLIIQGSANTIIARYKQLLMNQVLAVMTNAVVYLVQSLQTITRCKPKLIGADDSNEIYSKEDSTTTSTTDPNLKVYEDRHQSEYNKSQSYSENLESDNARPQSDNGRPQSDSDRQQSDNERLQTDNERPLSDSERLQSDNERPQSDNDRPKSDTEQPSSNEETATPDSKIPLNGDNQGIAVNRQDSIELEVPLSPDGKPKRMKLNYNETFSFSEIKP